MMGKDELKKKRKGFIMVKDNVEVKCTRKFLLLWFERGFQIKRSEFISLMD